jgi:predicted aconitase with swiveling domain
MGRIIRGRPIVSGEATGEALVSEKTLSFWGGYDHSTGEITDRRHPLSGRSAAEKILAIPSSRGSSTTTAVLLEAVRAGTAPLAIITTAPDTFFALASIVSDELYGRRIPIIQVTAEDFAELRSGDHLGIAVDGEITVSGAGSQSLSRC